MGELVRRTDGEGLACSKDTWHEMAGDRRFLFLQRTELTVLTATWCNREAPHGGRARSASTARGPCGLCSTARWSCGFWVHISWLVFPRGGGAISTISM